MIRRSDFQDLLKRRPEITTRIIELLCERLRFSSERLEEASLLSLRARLARRLLKLAEDFGEDIEITQEELGLLAGVSRAVVNRSLAELEDEKLIRTEHGRISVLNLAALKTY